MAQTLGVDGTRFSIDRLAEEEVLRPQLFGRDTLCGVGGRIVVFFASSRSKKSEIFKTI
jgi:hypothetical protein